MISAHRLQLFLEGFSKGLGVFMGIFKKSSVRSDTDVGQEAWRHSNSSQKCFIRLVSSFHWK